MIKIDKQFIDAVSAQARASARLRKNYNFHEHDSATLQRMLNAMEPETYIQPHKHESPDKVEAFFCLQGRLLVVEYNDEGQIVDHIVLHAASGSFGCEIPARTWHSIISLESGSVAYEVKDGPYDPTVDKHFAAWAPPEGHAEAAAFNRKVLRELGFE